MKKLLILLLLTIQVSDNFAMRVERGENVIISKPVYEDLYISGGTITINAPIHGDLICAGGTIRINDSVMNDILVAGGKVIFNGFVGDDIRCAGGELIVFKSICGDLLVAGGKVTVKKGVIIENGLFASGGELFFNGTVKENMKAEAGTVIFNGIAEKNVDFRGSLLKMNGRINGLSILAAPEILIGNKAIFNDNVRYWNKNGSLNFKNSITSGKAFFDYSLKIDTRHWYYLGGITIVTLLWYIGMSLFMIVIIQYLFGSIMEKAGDTSFNKTLLSFTFGLLFFIVVPIAIVIAFISFIGMPVGFFLIFNFITIAMFALVISAVVIANWFNNRNNYKWAYWKLVFAAFVILIVFKLISFIPFFGGFMMLILVCISFGAIILNISRKKKLRKAQYS